VTTEVERAENVLAEVDTNVHLLETSEREKIEDLKEMVGGGLPRRRK
jgi:hypothetical protein